MSNTSTNESPRVMVGTITITAVGDNSCWQSLCGERNKGKNASEPSYWRCAYTPRYAEALIESAIKSKNCTEDQFNVTAPPQGMILLYPEDRYPTICTFSDQECAQRVCNTSWVQESRINATDDGKSWSCYGDSAVAQAAVDAKYWFATTNDTWPCKGAAPSCNDLEGRSYDNVLPEGMQPNAAIPETKMSWAFLVFTVSTTCIAVLGASGATVI